MYGDIFCKNTFHFEKIKDVLEHTKTFDPNFSEGFVVCDKNYNRFEDKLMLA